MLRNCRKEGEGRARGTEKVPRPNARTNLEGCHEPTALPVSAKIAQERFLIMKFEYTSQQTDIIILARTSFTTNHTSNLYKKVI